MKRAKKRVLAILMAGVMLIPSMSSGTSIAADEGIVIEDAETTDSKTESSSEAIVEENSTEGTTVKVLTEEELQALMEEETLPEDLTEEEQMETEDQTESEKDQEEAEILTEEGPEEETTEEEVPAVVGPEEPQDPEEEKEPSFATPVSGVSVDGLDFSTKELLIGTENPFIFTWDTTVVSGYEGMYLVRFETEEETRNAYTYYCGKAEFVAPNITFQVSDEDYTNYTNVADLTEINSEGDALANLNEMEATSTPDRTIALIDTGVNADDLVDRVSVIGESVTDDNGHGTSMYAYMREEFPTAKIMSIKALGADGRGKASDIYAAITYAIESKVDVINLSISAFSTADNAVVRAAIEEAIGRGITVVGAAGNYSANAKYYIPGNISEAVIVGACDENGQKLSSSNFGATVDFYVTAESTSEAAARMSAMIAEGEDIATLDKVFLLDDDGQDICVATDDDFLIQAVRPDSTWTKASISKTKYYANIWSNLTITDSWTNKASSHCVEYVVQCINNAKIKYGSTDIVLNTTSTTVDEIFYELAGTASSDANAKKVYDSTRYKPGNYTTETSSGHSNNFTLVASYAGNGSSHASAAKDLNNKINAGVVKAGDIIVITRNLNNLNAAGNHFIHVAILTDMAFGVQTTIRGNAVAFSKDKNRRTDVFGDIWPATSITPYQASTSTVYANAYLGFPTVANYFNNGVEIGSALSAMFGAESEKEGDGYFVFRVKEEQDYYLAIQKKQTNNSYALNDVPFTVGVSTTGKSGSWTTVTAKTGFYTNLTTGVATDIRKNYSDGPRTTQISVDNMNISPIDGYAYIYLGKFSQAPYVYIHEEWADNAMAAMVIAEKNVKAVYGADFIHDNHHYYYQLDDNFTSLNSAKNYTQTATIYWKDKYPVDTNGTQVQSDGNSTRVWGNTEKAQYYVAIQKKQTNNSYDLNGVPFIVGVSETGQEGSWKTVTAKTGFYTNLTTGKETDIHKNYASGPRNVQVAVDGMNVSTTDGYAYVYLGRFAEAPYVSIQENWGDTVAAEMVVAEKDVRTVYGSDFIHDKNQYYYKLNNYFTSLSSARDHVQSSVMYWKNKYPVNSSGTQVASDGSTSRAWGNTEKTPYFVAIEKKDSKGYLLNEVPFQVTVSESGKNGTWVPSGSKRQVKTGYYTNLLTQSIKDIQQHPTSSSTQTADISIIEGDQVFTVTPRDGYAIVYLGKYENAPYVSIRENWGDDITAERVNGSTVTTVKGSDFVRNSNWYTYQLNSGFNTIQKAIESTHKATIYWAGDTSPVNDDGTINKEKGRTTINWTNYELEPYFVAFKKENGAARAVNGVTFDITVNGVTTTKGAISGWFRNLMVDQNSTDHSLAGAFPTTNGSASQLTSVAKPIYPTTYPFDTASARVPKGVGIVYVGRFATAPTVSLKENWTTSDNRDESTAELIRADGTVLSKVISSDYADTAGTNAQIIDPDAYTKVADAIEHAPDFKMINEANPVNYYLTIQKSSYVSTNAPSMEGTEYTLYYLSVPWIKFVLAADGSVAKVSRVKNPTNRIRVSSQVFIDDGKLYAKLNIPEYIEKDDGSMEAVNQQFYKDILEGTTIYQGKTDGSEEPHPDCIGHQYLRLVETKSNGNYDRNPEEVYVSLVQDFHTALDYTTAYNLIENPTPSFTLKKSSANPSCTDGNPNYSLAGTTYEVYTTRAAAQAKNPAVDEYIGKLVVQEDGTTVYAYNKDAPNTPITDGILDVPEGKMRQNTTTKAYLNTQFYAVETVAGKGYELNTAPVPFTVTPENTTDSAGVKHPAIIDASDNTINDPIDIQLTKRLLNGGTGAGLEGAEFTVNFYAVSTDTAQTFSSLSRLTPTLSETYTTDADGHTNIPRDDDHYPLGYITIEETKAPANYQLDGADIKVGGLTSPAKMCIAIVPETVTIAGIDYLKGSLYLIDEAGNRSAQPVSTLASTTNPQLTITIDELPERGDIYIQKHGQNDEPLSNIRFEVENVVTGEKHYLVTDADGQVSTHKGYVAHATNTNGYDTVTYTQGKVDYTGKAGVWFSKIKNGTAIDTQAVTADEGALPVGRYYVTEVDSNGNQKEERIEVEVTKDSIVEVYDSNKTGSDPIIYNMPLPQPDSVAMVILATGDATKTAPSDQTVTVQDTFSYTNLRCSTTFTLHSILWEKTATGRTKKASKIQNFTTKTTYEKSLYEASDQVIVNFDGLTLDPGATYVVSNAIYYGILTETDIENGNYLTAYPNSNNTVVVFPVSHDDMDDADQTVQVEGTLQVEKTVDLPGESPAGAVYRATGTTAAGETFSHDFTIGANGKSEKISIPYGVYEIKEISGPTEKPGLWDLDPNTYTATIEAGKATATIGVDLAFTGRASEIVVKSKDTSKTYVSLIKTSTDGNEIGNPNYSLAGAVYKVFDSPITAAASVISGDYSAAIGTLETDETGKAKDVVDVTAYMAGIDSKEFYAIEVTPAKNYLRDLSMATLTVTKPKAVGDPQNGVNDPATFTVSDTPVKIPVNVLIEKINTLNGDGNTSEGESLAGAVFTLNYYPESLDTIHTTFTAAPTAKTITIQKNGDKYTGSLDEEFYIGYITVEETTLPTDFDQQNAYWTVGGRKDTPVSTPLTLALYGTYNTGKNAFTPEVYDIRTATTAAELATKGKGLGTTAGKAEANLTAGNSPVRGDVEVVKYDVKTGHPMEGVKFKIENQTTHEVHYIYTDATGKATTRTDNYRYVNYYDTKSDYDTTAATVWFEKGTQKALTATNGFCALPAGSYTITEMDCAANADYQERLSKEFVIKSKKDGGTDGQLFQYTIADGKVYNTPVSTIKTTAIVSGGITDKLSYAKSGVTVTDRVDYEWLKNSTTFTLIGKIMEVKADGTVTEFATSQPTKFTTAAGTGKSQYEACDSTTVTFTNLDFSGKQGCKFVVYQYLYLGEVTSGTGVQTSYGPDNRTVFPLVHDNKEDTDQLFDVCGTIQVHKTVDLDGADPSGAEYTIKGVTDTTFKTVVIIGANGYSDIAQVPAGEYTIEETKVPTNGEWNKDTTVYKANIVPGAGKATIGSTLTSASEGVVESTDYPVVKVYLEKVSAVPALVNPRSTGYNTNYSLKNAKFNLFESKADAEAFINGSGNKVIGTFTTDENGATETLDVSAYMHGVDSKDFYLVEIAAPQNFLRHAEPIKATVLKTNNSQNPAKVTVSDTPAPVHVSLNIEKIDKMTGSSNTAKGESLEDAKFTVRYYPSDVTKTTYEGNASSSEVLTIKKDAATGKYTAALSKDYYFGFLVIEETQLPTGYTDENIKITVDGKEVTMPTVIRLSADYTGNQAAATDKYTLADGTALTTLDTVVENTPVRGDVDVIKVDQNGDPIQNVKFEIKNKVTGEVHYIFTGADGKATTQTATYTNVNLYGASDDIDPAVGPGTVWFKTGEQGDIDPKDGFCALPAGHYEIREVACAANSNFQTNETQEFDILDKENGGLNGQIYHLTTSADGRFYNVPIPFIKTEAKVENGLTDKLSYAKSGVTVTDKVSYQWLKVNTEFTFVGKIMEIAADGTVSEFATSEKTTFTTGAGAGHSMYDACDNVTVTFRNLDFTGKQGSSFVVYQYLYLGTDTEGAAVKTSYGNNNVKVAFPIEHAQADDVDQIVDVCGTIQVHKLLDIAGADPSGAKYTITGITDTTFSQVVTIGADGWSEVAYVPTGQYMIKETTLPTNGEWAWDTTEYKAEVKPYSGKHVIGSTLTAVSEGIVESTDHGVVKAFLTKKSTEPAALNNANYSLAGAEYQLYETEAKAKAGKAADVIGTFTTDATGKANTIELTDYMKNVTSKTFYLVETKAATNFLRNTSVIPVTVLKTNNSANPAEFVVSDVPVKVDAAVRIEKIDKVTGSSNTAKGESLAGAQFTVEYYPTDVTKTTYSGAAASSETVTVRKDTDGKYKAALDKDYYLGFLVIKEVTLPKGYTKDNAKITVDGKEVTEPIVIRMSGTFNADSSAFTKQYSLADGTAVRDLQVVVENTPIRGDVEVQKVDLDGNPIEGIKFEIKNNDTGEIHYIYTDASGKATTVTAEYTNANYYDTVTDYEKGTTATVWFAQGEQEEIQPKDGAHALPAGHYTMTERPCKANENLQLAEPEDFEIKSKEDGGTDGQLATVSTYTDGNFYNAPAPTIKTTARVENGLTDKMSYAKDGMTVTDRVDYQWLRNSTTYTLVGKIMELDKDGNAISVFATSQPTTFTTAAGTGKSLYEACGNTTVTFTGLDFTGKQGTSFVVYQYLYLGTETSGAAVLADYGNNNTVTFPLLHEKPDDAAQIIDVCGTIQVHKLLDLAGQDPSGAQYQIKGVTDNSFNKVVTIDATGWSEIVYVPAGKYQIQETALPTNGEWTIDETVYNAEIKPYSGTHTIASTLTSASEGIVESTDYPVVKAYLVKSSTDASVMNNVNYSLKDAKYNLYETRAKAEAFIRGEGNDLIGTFTTKEDGTTEVMDLTAYMHGADKKNFYLVETKAAKNFKRSAEIAEVEVLKTNNSANPAKFEVADEPVKVDAELLIEKIDKLTGSSNTAKGKSLIGAKFTVAYYPSDIEKATYEGSPAFTDTLTVTEKKNGKYTVNLKKEYELGYLVITEIELPTEYTADGAQIIVNGENGTVRVNMPLVIRMAGTFNADHTVFTKAYSMADGTAVKDLKVAVENTPLRGDLGLIKKDVKSGQYMANVEFQIENLDTHEKHVMVTDANGLATTKATHYTEDSVWFKTGEDGDIDPVDGYGALPYGRYQVTELRCAANMGYQLNAPSEVLVIDKDHPYAVVATAMIEEDGTYYFYNVPNPTIKTTAVVEATGTKSMPQDGAAGQKGEPQTIVDTVVMDNLRENTTYTLVGRLQVVDHRTGKTYAYKQGDAEYVITQTFTTEAGYTKSRYEKAETQTLRYTVYPENYEGCSFVVYNRLYYGTDTDTAAQYEEIPGCDLFPLIHEDPANKDQTVEVVDIATQATDGVDETQIAQPKGKRVIKDQVAYTGLTVGEEYTISGEIHVTGYTWKDKDGNEIKNVNTDEPLKDAQGRVITASKTFTATKSAGIETLEFEIDADQLQGQSIVVFENLYYKDTRLALHGDLSDSSETIHYPNMHTTLYRGGTGSWAEPDFDENDITKATTPDESAKEVLATKNAVVIDRIKVHNILANESYIIRGVLMDKATGQTLKDANGNEVTVEQRYTAPTVSAVPDTKSPHSDKYICADGTVLTMSADHADYLVDDVIEVTFPAFDASKLGKHTSVAFEKLYLLKDGKEILVSDHSDLTDSDQAVRFVAIGTEATVEESRTKLVTVDVPITINDAVEYHNLCIGKSYTLQASIAVKNDKSGYYADGDLLKDAEGKVITATHTFVAQATDGVEIVPITFKGYLTAEMDMVCFEDLSNDKGLEIAVHASLEDESQETYKAWIGTTATVDGKHFVMGSNTVAIKDRLEYHNLIPNRQYRAIGELVRKSDGQKLGVVAEKLFTPQERNGFVEIDFPEIDATNLRGDAVVVFEKLYIVVDDTFEAEVANHEKLDSAEQTIIFPELKTTLYRAGAGEWVDDTENESTKEVMAAENATVIDKVVCKNIIPGQYILKGVLMDKATGQPAHDAQGNEIRAEKKFTITGTETVDETVEVIFTFDASKLGNHTLVAYEDLYLINTGDESEELVCQHYSMDDHDQTVRFIEIHTDAEVEETKTQMIGIGEETTINDSVHYANLVADGREYTLTATVYVVHDKAGYYNDGDALTTVDGQVVTKTITFVPTASDGDVVVPITFKGHITAEMDMVCFEDLSNDKGLLVATHSSLEDKRQTTYKVWIGTTATVDGEHFVMADNHLTVKDECEVHNVLPGLKYRLDGKIVRKSDGSVLKDAQGNDVTAFTEFVPDEKDTFVTVEFKDVDASDLRGDDLVVFETLRIVVDDEFSAVIGVHESLDDLGQTISFPNIHTTLYRYDAEEQDIQDDSAKEVMTESGAVVEDRVWYEHLIAGTYHVEGVLIDKATGETAKDADGQPITGSTDFTVTGEGFHDGYATVVFTFNAEGMGERTLVAYETLSIVDTATDETRIVSLHHDRNDMDQTVRFVEIGTKATTDTRTQLFTKASKTTVYDTVSYHNVKPGKEYSMTCTIVVTGDKTGYYKEGDQLKDVNGNVITKTITFIPEKPDGEIVVPVTFEGYLIPETRMICFETMKNDKGLTVAVHSDISDRDQSTFVVGIKTKANVGDLPVAVADLGIVVTDEVEFHNALPNYSYKLKSDLVQKSTGKKLGVTAETEFTAKDTDGTVTVTFPAFDASGLAGDSVVCFEKLYLIVDGNEYEIASHESLEDQLQTILFPGVKTVAAGKAGSDTLTITDSLQFTNLALGYEYVVKGVVVKADGTPVVVDGTEIAAEKRFTPTEATGSVDITFPAFDPFYLYGGRKDIVREYKYIVFEELYVVDADGSLKKVGEHRDLTDPKQTLSGDALPTPTTGDDTPVKPLFILLGLSMAGSCGIVWKKKRKRSRKTAR